jgi:hypothetical protein
MVDLLSAAEETTVDIPEILATGCRQLVTQFSQADLVKRISIGWRCNQGLIPIEVCSALVIDGLSDYLTVEVRPAFHSYGGVRSINHNKGIGAASYGHSTAATIVDDEIARKKCCIGKVAAGHVQHRPRWHYHLKSSC